MKTLAVSILLYLLNTSIAMGKDTEPSEPSVNNDSATTITQKELKPDTSLDEQQVIKLNRDMSLRMGEMNKAIQQKISVQLNFGFEE